MDSGSQVLYSSLCQWNLDPGFQSLVGYRIPWVIFWIPKPRSPDSKSKSFPDSGFPYEGDSRAWRKHKPDENKTRLIFPQPPCFIDHHRSVITIRLWFYARFRLRSSHEPNLSHRIKYMNTSASESIRNACFNLERLSRSFRLARPGISPLNRLWNAFDSDAELFCNEPNE